MYNFKSNDLIDAVLYDKHKVKSYIKYRLLLFKIRKLNPDYRTLEIIYDFMDQLNFAYFHCLNNENKLFIGDSRRRNQKNTEKSLMYKDSTVTIILRLKPNDIINLEFKRYMGYPETNITFHNGEITLENKLEEQLFINCTNLIMNELYIIIKKYRKFGRLKVYGNW